MDLAPDLADQRPLDLTLAESEADSADLIPESVADSVDQSRSDLNLVESAADSADPSLLDLNLVVSEADSEDLKPLDLVSVAPEQVWAADVRHSVDQVHKGPHSVVLHVSQFFFNFKFNSNF